MNLSFRNRIALYYMTATAVAVLLVFIAVHQIVRSTVYRNIDNDLIFEATKHTSEVHYSGDSVLFNDKAEWEEREHYDVQVNPVFIELLDAQGRVMDKSPNLKKEHLHLEQNHLHGKPITSKLNNSLIRLVDVPIVVRNEVKGHIVAAMSFESSQAVINNLKHILFISYPLILIMLFFLTRFLAGRSIVPVKRITETAKKLTKNSLNERVSLPEKKDELYDLSYSFNELLQRIEDAMTRERQFTSDASHELRTPLASLRGTLEVLIRRPRSKEEYEDKIKYSLTQVDHMSNTLEQLLLLARANPNNAIEEGEMHSLKLVLNQILKNYQKEISDKQIEVFKEFTINKDYEVHYYYSQLLFDNLISNAIKYSKTNGQLFVSAKKTNQGIECQIRDTGLGIKEEDLEQVFQPFYRSQALEHKEIKGNGLGLSIARKVAQAMNAELKLESSLMKGTTVTVIFKEI